MRICVYTCITGSYDILKEIEYKNEELDYLCFTNNQSLKSNSWTIINVDEAFDDLLLQRKIKICCCHYLKDYDASLYIDGKVLMRKDVLPFIQKSLEYNVELVGFKHFERNCIYDEIYSCVLLEREKLSTGMQIYNKYQSEGFPRHYGLSDTAIMFRRHTDAVASLMNQWFYMVETYSRRDQLSFFYCLWKNPIPSFFIQDNIFDNDYFATDYWHYPQTIPKLKRCLADFNPEQSYDPALLVENTYMSGTSEVVLEFVVPERSNSFRICLDELGNWLLGYSTDPKLKVELIYGIGLEQQFLLISSHSLRLSGKLEKGETIKVKLRIKEIPRFELTQLLYQCNLQRLDSISKQRELERQLVTLEKTLQEELRISKQQFADIQLSYSYKIGRTFTWPFRKIRVVIRCLRGHGFHYTVRRILDHLMNRA